MSDLFIVMTERDTADWRNSEGPIIHETNRRNMSLIDAIERITRLSGRYGKAQIYKLVPVTVRGELEE